MAARDRARRLARAPRVEARAARARLLRARPLAEGVRDEALARDELAPRADAREEHGVGHGRAVERAIEALRGHEDELRAARRAGRVPRAAHEERADEAGQQHGADDEGQPVRAREPVVGPRVLVALHDDALEELVAGAQRLRLVGLDVAARHGPPVGAVVLRELLDVDRELVALEVPAPAVLALARGPVAAALLVDAAPHAVQVVVARVRVRVGARAAALGARDLADARGVVRGAAPVVAVGLLRRAR